MRIIITLLLLASFSLQAQQKTKDKLKWKIDKNKIITGSLVFVGGAQKVSMKHCYSIIRYLKKHFRR
jgi:hypothetical protein